MPYLLSEDLCRKGTVVEKKEMVILRNKRRSRTFYIVESWNEGGLNRSGVE